MALASQSDHKSHISTDDDDNRTNTFAETEISVNKDKKNKCKFFKDPLNLALIIGILALLFSIFATLMTHKIVNKKVDRLQDYPSTYGITNINETYTPGISVYHIYRQKSV